MRSFRGEGDADRRRDRHFRREGLRRRRELRVSRGQARALRGDRERTGSRWLVDDVQVQVGARLRVDLQMSVGQLSEKVEVTSSQPLVETDSSQRGQVISGEQIRALPLTRASSWRC